MATTPSHSPHNLPVPSSSFIGRERVIADIKRLMTSTRLLTLTGPGGCGKTRLALQLAEQLSEDYPGGVWFVELASLSDPSLVLQVVASTFDLHEQPDWPLDEVLIGYLQPREALLILDNCEHLVAACAALAATLLGACPQLHLVVTSREPLNLLAETVWLVPPLALPDLMSALPFEQFATVEAIQLFVTRAHAALPDFTLTTDNAAIVTQICRRLDGIPLAIELAAARIKLLDVEQIAKRLDDSLQLLTHGTHAAPSRHQTMRAALEWSYELLSARERALFQRLSVFAGGCTLEAVEAVCSDDNLLPTSVILDILADLMDKSLALIADRTPGEAVRYRLLEPIRQYALEQLRQAGDEEATCQRHLAYFVEFAEQAEPQLKGPNQTQWLQHLDKEHDNLRAALAWSALDASRDLAGLRLAKALHYFWHRRSYWHEGRRWLEETIANYDAHRDPQSPIGDLYLARAIVAEGLLAYQQNDYGGIRTKLERGLALAQALNDSNTAAMALGLQAQLTSYAGNIVDALALSEAGITSARQSGDRWTLAWNDYIYAMIVYRRDEAAARAALDESVRLFREVGDKRSIATYLNVLGYITANAGELDAAHALFEEALTIGYELEDKNLQIVELGNLASLAQLQGDAARAIELHEQVLAQARDLGFKANMAGSLKGLGVLHIDQGELDTADQLLRESLQLYQEIEFHSGVAMALAGLSRIVAAQGRPATAARMLGAVEAALKASATRMDADNRLELDRAHAAVRAALTPQAFEAAFTAGQAMTLEQVWQDASFDDLDSSSPSRSDVPAISTLRVFALGPMRVLQDEQAVTAWPFAKVKELLFYLISQPPRTKAQLGLDLWPDASSAQLRNSLSTTLYHLRRTLGHSDWIIFEDEHYRFNRARAHWFDVDMFETSLVQAARMKGSALEQAIALLQTALDLYQGDFVEDLLEGEWFLLRREDSRQKYLDALLQLGRLFFARHDYARAAEAYQRAIGKDEVLEEAHRELVRCYARSGERGQALRHYQSMTRILRNELGSPPAPESVDLYERLKRGEDV